MFWDKLSFPDILAIFGIIGVLNTVFWAYLRTQYIPRSYLFHPKDGTPIYRTITDCKEKEKELKKEQKEFKEHIQDEVESIKDSNEKFLKSLKGLLDTQTKNIENVVKNAVGP